MVKPRYLLTVWFVALFLFGQQAFITTSEFWPVTASRHLFDFSPNSLSLFFKPIFSTILFVFHLFPLTDTQHLQWVKSLFALNGALQIILLYLIFSYLSAGKKWLSIVLTVLFSISPYYLTNIYRIRSDQLALTAFFVFIWINVRHFKFSSPWNILFLVLFPLIGFKHVYFSLLALCLIDIKKAYAATLSGFRYEKFYFWMLIMGLFVWTTNLGIKALPYLLNTFGTSGGDDFYKILKLNFLIIIVGTVGFLSASFRRYLKGHQQFNSIYMIILLLVILSLHPQKFDFFIASLIPVFFITGGLLLIYLYERRRKLTTIILIFAFLFQLASLIEAQRYFPLYSTDRTQLKTIGRIGETIAKHRLSYLDGVGLLPRQKNLGCFISPDDFVSNSACLNQIAKGIPDAIIVNPRLLSEMKSSELIDKSGYEEIGPNFHVKKNLIFDFKGENLTWDPPNLLFGAYFVY